MRAEPKNTIVSRTPSRAKVSNGWMYSARMRSGRPASLSMNFRSREAGGTDVRVLADPRVRGWGWDTRAARGYQNGDWAPAEVGRLRRCRASLAANVLSGADLRFERGPSRGTATFPLTARPVWYTVCAAQPRTGGDMPQELFENLRLELRRGSVIVAVLAQLRTEH